VRITARRKVAEPRAMRRFAATLRGDVPVETLVLLAAAALFAGTVDAIAGGGGLVTVPALMAAGLTADVAIATNKGQSVWGSLAAAIAFWRAGRVDRRLAAFALPLAFAGAVIGSRLVLAVDKQALRPVVIAMLVGAAVVLAVKPPTGGETGARRPGIAALLAFVLGVYDGFFGPGVGTFLIVGFVAWCGRGLVEASADAKVVNVASNAGALVTFVLGDVIVWEVALAMAVAQLCGGMLGARLAMRGGARVVRIVVLVVSGALVVKLAFDLIN
jgi:uncharacterized membrane protein YfcA